MTGASFGQALGMLIRRKRKAAGLTQVQLAEDAYGDAGKTRRISELENGTVANPHLKTIDPIIVTLKITDAELEECAASVAFKPDEDLDRAYREARNLIDAVAKQFEHAQPSATLAELDEFLRGKAKEWSELRARLQAIDLADKNVAALRTAAAEALSKGEFDSVEQLLFEAEERFQKSETLQEVRKHAQLRIARADTYLLRGNPQRAMELYVEAAEFFRPFDLGAMEEVLNDLSHRAYEVTRRSLEPNFSLVLGLLDVLATVPTVQSDGHKKNALSYRKSLVLRNVAERSRGKAAQEALEQAILSARDALSGQTDKTSNTAVQANLSLSNCLVQQGEATNDASKIREAVSILRETKGVLEHSPRSFELLDHTCNSLGAALLALLSTDASISKEEILKEALATFSTAVKASEEVSNIEIWHVAKINVGSLLADFARVESNTPEDRIFLRVRAVCEFASACEVHPFLAFHEQFAFAQYQLGEVLFELAKSTPRGLAEAYLSRSMDAFYAASKVWDAERAPSRWASINLRLGRGFMWHAELDEVSTALSYYENALEHLNIALPIFEEDNSVSEVDACKRAIARATAGLSAAQTKTP
ncbi:helix-turn-helix domain-containing protein [Hyphomicrobium sp.]|uniref:helix-turn-helix domain-containing protein n=1 Tax=Hyphomicrobium sp. TaxID=82 RepID=UPI002FE0C177